ncbi:unnamed protein product [Clonostachys chloroleuca]|uniref:Uncharacterized protein n=1 Tax=Clonostachys chloroleuca TaxID=1926264 RepID=A0AA35PZQ0_9HYPO|nr:unnamed protein product [Clonostachys chloroleuca]
MALLDTRKGERHLGLAGCADPDSSSASRAESAQTEADGEDAVEEAYSAETSELPLGWSLGGTLDTGRESAAGSSSGSQESRRPESEEGESEEFRSSCVEGWDEIFLFFEEAVLKVSCGGQLKAIWETGVDNEENRLGRSADQDKAIVASVQSESSVPETQIGGSEESNQAETED